MTEIIDLGNGYGEIRGFPSKYAHYTFPLTRTEILRLYAVGALSRMEVQDILSRMNYEPAAIRLDLAIAAITTEQWREATERVGLKRYLSEQRQ